MAVFSKGENLCNKSASESTNSIIYWAPGRSYCNPDPDVTKHASIDSLLCEDGN